MTEVLLHVSHAAKAALSSVARPLHTPDGDSDFARKAAAAVTALFGAVLVALSWKPFSRLLAPDRDNVVVIYVAILN